MMQLLVSEVMIRLLAYVNNNIHKNHRKYSEEEVHFLKWLGEYFQHSPVFDPDSYSV